MESARAPQVRPRRAGAASRRGNDPVEASLRQPVFDPIRPWHERLQAAGGATLGHLNALADAAGLRTESGRPVRFVPPGAAGAYYEARVFESGCVETRPESLHDLFNALAWLAFPRTKARINAMHAERIPHERGRRGRPRELAPVPIFGYPGWLPGTERPEFYDDTRYFRRARRDSPRAYGNAG